MIYLGSFSLPWSTTVSSLPGVSVPDVCVGGVLRPLGAGVNSSPSTLVAGLFRAQSSRPHPMDL